jgi:IS5 family transposase
MRAAQVNLAIRWFAGYRLDEKLPDHSSLTRIRQRWGEDVFRAVFERSVRSCAEAGLVDVGTVHVDATLIRADVSWESLTTRHADQVVEAHRDEESDAQDDPPDDEPPKKKRGRPRGPGRPKKYSPTDPDATMATSNRGYQLEPTYKQHTAVEDLSGIIVDVAVTTGEASEGKLLLDQLDRIEALAAARVETVTADAAYAHAGNYGGLEERDTDAVIPPQRQARRKKGGQRIPSRRFKYDARKRTLTCPAGKRLRRLSRNREDTGYWYRALPCDCRACPMRRRCLSPKAAARSIMIHDAYPALLRARRRKAKGWDEETRDKYTRHRWRVEGVHGRAKSQHGLKRATRRGLANVSGQAYLTAAAMNLKTLAAALRPSFAPVFAVLNRLWRPVRRSEQQYRARMTSAA